MAPPPVPSNVRPLRLPEWIGGFLRLPAEVQGVVPDVALLLDGATGDVLGVKAGPPADSGDRFRDLVKRTRAEQGGRRVSVRVADAALASRLEGLELEVVVAPTPELDDARSLLEKDLEGRLGPESFLQEGRVSPGTVGRLFRAAAKLYRAAPWSALPDGFGTFRLDVPALGIDGGGLCVFGGSDEPTGWSIIEDAEAFRRFADPSDDAEGSSRVPTLELVFTAKADLPPTMKQELSRHRWTCVPGAVPQLVAVDADGDTRRHGEREAKLAAAAAEALVAFFERHGHRLEDAEYLDIKSSPEDLPEIRLTYPHPDALAEFEAELDDAVEVRAQSFVQASRAAGRDERWCALAVRVARTLQDRQVDAGLDLEPWSDGYLEFYLLDWAPRFLPVPAAEAVVVPPIVAAFFDFLRETEEIEPAQAIRAKATVARLAERALAAAADETRFAAEKRLGLAAEADGVDMDDAEAVTRYVEENRARFEPPAALKVGRNDPCPCGSGKKYKKCCGA
jgi:hypothetical protein